MKSRNPGRKIILSEFITIDGVREAPGGEPGFKYSGWSGHHGLVDKYRLMVHPTILGTGRQLYSNVGERKKPG